MSSTDRLRWLGAAALAAAVGGLAVLFGTSSPLGQAPRVSELSAPVATTPKESAPDFAAIREPALGRGQSALPTPSAAAEDPSAKNAESVGARVTGTVLLPGGQPAPGVPVGLLKLSRGGPLNMASHARSVTNQSGEFEIPVPPWATGQAVALVARRSGLRPDSLNLTLDAGALAARHELRLGEGSTVTGRVMRGGEPVEGLFVGIDIAYGIPGIQAAGRECWWNAGRLEEKYAEAETDIDGRFRFTGLATMDHRLEFQEPNAPPGRLPLHTFQVAAPTDKVFDITDAILSISVVDFDGRLEGAEVQAAMEFGSREWESGPEPFDLEVPADRKVRLELTHPSAEPRQLEVLAPGQGERMDVILRTVRIPRPRLVVTLDGEAWPAREGPLLIMKALDGGPAVSMRAAPLQRNPEASKLVFVVDEVPLEPGRYLLTLKPGPPGTAASFRYPGTCLVELPREGEVAVELDLFRGGRFAVSFEVDTDEPWSASYSLVDSNGTVCLTGWERSKLRASPGWESRTWERLEIDFGDVEVTGEPKLTSWIDIATRTRENTESNARDGGVLLPGFYALNVTSEELEPVVQAVEIELGKVSKVRLFLRPKKAAPKKD